ncbi:MAG: VanZ family protein [Erysipelotrichia bacterium]|nr:VanZ family protein [Erysipelotrichia bacterium]
MFSKLPYYIPDFAALAAVYIFIFLPRWKKHSRIKLIFCTVFYCYLCMVLYKTLMPIIVSLPKIFHHTYQPMNMSPFIDILEGHDNARQDIILNIVMMIPFGFLFPIITDRRVGRTVAAAFLLSLCIELFQPLISTYRVADISDVIDNTLGGLIGYLIYYPFSIRLKTFLHSKDKAAPEV